jgi:hypothetical protein
MTTHHHPGHSGHHGTSDGDEATVHRWVVFGADRVYLSHLSMFSMPEHALQVIVEAEFADGDGSPSTAYPDDRRSHPEQRLYPLDPALFVLPDILPTDSAPPVRTTLEADLYRDHVEKDNPARELIAPGIEVRIRRIVHARRYDPDAQPLSSLEYVLVGDAKEPHLAHFITRPPDFDQILRVTINGDVPADKLTSGLQLTIPKRANTLEDRLKEGVGAVPAILHAADGDINVEIEPEMESYCNFDRDLQ